MSSLRFHRCCENALHSKNTTFVEFGGFANAVLGYAFELVHDALGTVNKVVYSEAMESEKGVLDRMARVSIEKEGRHYFFYVFAEANTQALQKWKIKGRSILMQGRIRMPNFEHGMTWEKK